MTIDERKMAIAYADLLNIQEHVQHIMRMDADELFNPAAKKAFAQIAIQLDMVMACAAQYVALHTEFNNGEPNGRTES